MLDVIPLREVSDTLKRSKRMKVILSPFDYRLVVASQYLKFR